MARSDVSFNEASEQLAAAFARLEAAIEQSASASLPEIETKKIQAETEKKLQKELDGLRDENARLSEENTILSNKLQALQEDYIDLQTRSDQIADQIDQQIQQLELMA